MFVRDGPLPLRATRDLLGLARAMLHAESAKRAPQPGHVSALLRSIEGLELALELAASPVGTLGHGAAWSHVDRALEAMAATIALYDPAKPILEAACRRVSRRAGRA